MNKFMQDVKRFYKHAAIIGALLAIICHVVPPQYRVACDALARFCSFKEGSQP